jgi:hypothetical protein
MRVRHTDYCTCFYDDETQSVVFWDEIKDVKIRSIKVKDKAQAKKIMLEYIDSAPERTICQALDLHLLKER